MFTDLRKLGQRPLWMAENVWAELSAAWSSPDYSRKRDQNRQNRASDVGGLGSSLHTGGSVPHTKHRRCLKAVLGREPTPVELYSHTHKRQEDQRWVDERARKAFEEYTRIRESQTATGEGSSGRSTEYSDYRTWSQAITALTAELGQVRKAQADWQMQMQQQMEIQRQMQIQQTQMLEEMQRMREQMSSGKSTAAEEETDLD
ncbi:hypothetical protein IEQ34_014593 [Dendrobium chrysotoxum]|uniref:Uncharacterized protein n=1 Tax=Dendrobium chrysotoxum TaxID=161865 RepID=A0AAV7GJQ3_DENCH|nr:hypothetical protein IEQ34_014593 [Dendrobium chrysotoxum]